MWGRRRMRREGRRRAGLSPKSRRRWILMIDEGLSARQKCQEERRNTADQVRGRTDFGRVHERLDSILMLAKDGRRLGLDIPSAFASRSCS